MRDRYALLSIRGQGGAGTTYRAQDLDGDTVVAVKELPLRVGLQDKQTELFQREARVLKQLRHDSIPTYIDDFQAGTGKHRALYLVQAFVEGEDLQQSLERQRYSPRDALELLAELLPVLSYLHELSPPVVHRDLKPQNLIRETDTGRLYLVDFGAVRDALHDELGGSTVAGTFGFMAPEQFMGSSGPATDLYGLGATVVALLSRKPLNSLLDTHRVLQWQAHVQLPSPVAQLLSDLLQPDPADRPTSARHVSARVDALLSGAPLQAIALRSAPALPAPRPAQAVATPGSLFLGAPGEISLDQTVRGRVHAGQHARLTTLIEQCLGMPAGRVEVVGDLFRWSTPAETNRMVRISLADQGDGTTRIQVWERLSGRAGALFGGLMGGVGGGMGGGFSAVVAAMFGVPAAGAWLGLTVGGSYVLARVLYTRTARARREELERAMEHLTHLVETGT